VADILDISLNGSRVAAQPGGDGMPIGNTLVGNILPGMVEADPDGVRDPQFTDDAAATIVWEDYQRAAAYLDSKLWLAEWQYIDELYQSPTFDYDWRTTNQTARISRFNIAKNSNTMSNQVRRGIFAEDNPFLLKPRGRLAGSPNAQTYIDAWTEIFAILDDRADFEYNFGLLIESQTLQGTGIGVPGWQERTTVKRRRRRVKQPVPIALPLGAPKVVNTQESDDFKMVEEEVTESWPYFEFRRLGTTLWDPKCSTPNRPDLSAGYRIDYDPVTFEDLQAMRRLDCYKDIPDDEDLKRFFLDQPVGDAQGANQTADQMTDDRSLVMHAVAENVQTSKNPFSHLLSRYVYWTAESVMELIEYAGRKKIIRNEPHELGDHALGYTANWWNIPYCLYGMGVGRLNAPDQRMDQGVLNKVLEMIGFPLNAPIIYNSASGNAPTQQVVMGLGTLWGINAPSGDIRKEMMWMQPPTIPAEAWKIYELGKQGGEDLVGANNSVMQGNNTGTQGIGRTAAGVNRLGSKADETISDPLSHLEGIIVRWTEFKAKMVRERMPIAEIREILSAKFAAAIVDQIDMEEFLDFEFEVKVLAGQKLAAKAAIAQLIPFLLQIVQQPQLMEYMHQKGWTIDFKAIEDLFMQMSELQGRQDIIVPLTPEEQQQVQQANPNAMRVQAAATLEKLKGANKLQEVQAKGAQDIQKTLVDKALDHISGDVPLELAEARLERNTDMGELQSGVPGLGE